MQLMVDYHACKWPASLANGEDLLAQHFDSLNEPWLSNLDSILEMDEDDTGVRPPLITFSHFLPNQVTILLALLSLHSTRRNGRISGRETLHSSQSGRYRIATGPLDCPAYTSKDICAEADYGTPGTITCCTI